MQVYITFTNIIYISESYDQDYFLNWNWNINTNKLNAKFTFHAWEFQENLLICFPLNPTLGNSTKVTYPLPHPISSHLISSYQNNISAYFNKNLPRNYRLYFFQQKYFPGKFLDNVGAEIKSDIAVIIEFYCYWISCIILLGTVVAMHVFKSCRQRRFCSASNLNSTTSKSKTSTCIKQIIQTQTPKRFH